METSNLMTWAPFSDEALSQAKSQNKPVIIDFSADWCLACTELDKLTYSDKSVIEKSKGFVLIKVDASKITDEIKTLQKRYEVVGLPTVIFIDGSGVVKKDLTLTGFEEPANFLTRMSKAF